MSKQTIELALGLKQLADPEAWASPEALEQFRADAVQRAAELREGTDVPDPAGVLPEMGALDGTARILLAAVQRLAEENGRLAAEVAALRGAAGGGEALRAEALEAVEGHRAEVAVFTEAADERQTAAGDAFTATEETLPDGFVAGDAADEFGFPDATW